MSTQIPGNEQPSIIEGLEYAVASRRDASELGVARVRVLETQVPVRVKRLFSAHWTLHGVRVRVIQPAGLLYRTLGEFVIDPADVIAPWRDYAAATAESNELPELRRVAVAG